MDPRIRQLIAHTDLEERLQLVPASAMLRGLYFKNNVAVMKAAGLFPRFLEFYPETYSAVRWYPIADFLERLAVAGALLKGPENVHDGIREIGRRNALAFSESLLGKAMLRLLDRDPVKLLKQASAGRRQSCRYGRWEVSFPAPGRAVMAMYEEYLWLESNVLGAAEGTFHSIGRDVRVTVELDSKFTGRHLIEWDATLS